MKITQHVDENVWWEVANQCEYATFFHTPLWHKLITETFPEYENASLYIEFGDDARAILPLIRGNRLKGLAQVYFSAYAGCYGGLIATDHVPAEIQQEIYEHIYSNSMCTLHITSNPIHDEVFDIDGFSVQKDFTHILLLDSDFETIFRNFSKGHRSSMRRGERMGVCVRMAKTLDDYAAYYGAYEDSLRRWGDNATSSYPWKLFENGFSLSQQYPENIKLWLAEVDGAVIAGALVFYWNDHIDWWHGAAYEDWFDHYPNNVLQTQIIQDALEKGFRYYDFNPSGGHESVARFKKRFGATEWPVMRYQFETSSLKVGRKISSLFRSS